MRTSGAIGSFAVPLLLTLAGAAFAADADELPSLLARVEDLRQEHDVAAVGLTLVSRDELLWTGAFGVVDRQTREPASADTVFRIGSITKTFTSLAVLMLEEQGKLRLDDPLRTAAPAAPFANPWEQTDPVRVGHLLEHTAGFHDLLQVEWDHNDPAPITLEAGLAVSPESRTSQWRPGEHSSYSNSGAGLAGYALEVVSGIRYEEFVERRLFAPLGMESAGFFLDDDTRRRLATGYDTDGTTPIPYWHMILRPFGGINASPRNMAPFVQLLMNDGRRGETRLLSAASVRRLETPMTTLAARAGLVYGYGLGSYAWSRDGFVFHGHGGDGDGYLAHYGYNRDTGLGYFVVITAFDHAPLRALRGLVEGYIVAGAQPPARVPVAKLGAAQLERYAGLYERATRRFAGSPASTAALLRITVDGGRLLTQMGSERRRPLVPVTERLFRRPWEPVATAAFVKDASGRTILQGGMGNYRRLQARSTAPAP